MFAKTSLSQFKLSNNQQRNRSFNTSLTSFKVSKSQTKNNQKFGKFQIEKLDFTSAFPKQSFLPPHSLRNKKNNTLILPNVTFTQDQFNKHSVQVFFKKQDNTVEEMKKFSPLLSSKRRAAKCKIQTKAKMAFKQLLQKQQESKNKVIQQSQVQQLNQLLQNSQRRKLQNTKQPYLNKQRCTQQFGIKNNNSINTNLFNQFIEPTQKTPSNIQSNNLLQMLKKSQQQRKKLQNVKEQTNKKEKKNVLEQIGKQTQSDLTQKNVQSKTVVQQLLKKSKKVEQQKLNYIKLIQKQQSQKMHNQKQNDKQILQKQIQKTQLDSRKELKTNNQTIDRIQNKKQIQIEANITKNQKEANISKNQKEANITKNQMQAKNIFGAAKKNSFNLQSVQELQSLNMQRKPSTNNNLDSNSQKKVQQYFNSQKQTNLPKDLTNFNKTPEIKQQIKGNVNNNNHIKQVKQINHNTKYQQNDDLEQIDFNTNKNKKQQKIADQIKSSNKNIKQDQSLSNKNKTDKNISVSSLPKDQINLNKQGDNEIESRQQFQEDQDEVMDQIYFYFDRNQDLCNFAKQSKDFYSNSDSSMIQLTMNNKLLTYYTAHQFYYYTNIFLEIFNQKKTFYTVTADEIKEALQDEAFQQQVQQLKINLQKTKKLIMNSFKNCKMYLKKNEQELVIQVKNYHQKCLQYLKKQFKGVYQIYAKNSTNRSVARRCSYLIQMWTTMNLLNKRELKQHEDIQEIQDFDLHIKTFKHLILANEDLKGTTK